MASKNAISMHALSLAASEAAASTSPPSLSSWQPLSLDDCDSLSLSRITSSFSAPITEEHAFAVVYECVRTLSSLTKESSAKLAVVNSTQDILIHRDGRVHETTYRLEATSPTTSPAREKTDSEDKIITSLGLVIYSALDFGLKENEERKLTPGLENLLDLMTSLDDSDEEEEEQEVPMALNLSEKHLATSAGHRGGHSASSNGDTDDEGIEKDHEEEERAVPPKSKRCRPPGESISRVLSLCANHLSVHSEADNHFRAVCRALVSEALELSTFLEKAKSHDSQHSEELRDLALKDWAHLWIQTMYELRQGVKLKKTNYTKTPIEYELTPYEILMDDIRSRRYKLNKVMVDGELPPRIKRDAHDIILEFIRSRPPLKPVSRRQLAPARKYSTPQELLMQDIRSKKGRYSLKKTPGGMPEPKNHLMCPTRTLSCSTIIEVPGCANANSNNNVISVTNRSKSSGNLLLASSSPSIKKIIRPDPSFINFDPDDDSDDKTKDEEVFSTENGAENSVAENCGTTVIAVNGGLPSCPRRSVHFGNDDSSSNSSGGSGNNSPVVLRSNNRDVVIVDRSRSGQLSKKDDAGEEKTRRSSVQFIDGSWRQRRNSSSKDNFAPNSYPNPSFASIDEIRHNSRLKSVSAPRPKSAVILTPSANSSGQQQHRHRLFVRDASSSDSCNTFYPGGLSSSVPSPICHSSPYQNLSSSYCQLPHPRHYYHSSANYSSNYQSMPYHSATTSFSNNQRGRSSSVYVLNQDNYSERMIPKYQSHGKTQQERGGLLAKAARKMSNGPKVASSSKRQLPAVPENARTDKFEQWASSLHTLDLTLAEVVHIRTVLTKAELEGLTIDAGLREDLERAKVCFLCMKVKFGIFNWSYTCQLCQHAVCSGCLTKMRIPAEHFSNIPVFALSPTSTTKVRKNSDSSIERHQKTQRRRSFVGTISRRMDLAEATSHSPYSSSSETEEEEIEEGERRAASAAAGFLRSLQPSTASKSESRVKLRRANTTAGGKRPSEIMSRNVSGGKNVNVCVDCKDMIYQIIRSQRAQRRAQFTKSLCLN